MATWHISNISKGHLVHTSKLFHKSAMLKCWQQSECCVRTGAGEDPSSPSEGNVDQRMQFPSPGRSLPSLVVLYSTSYFTQWILTHWICTIEGFIACSLPLVRFDTDLSSQNHHIYYHKSFFDTLVNSKTMNDRDDYFNLIKFYCAAFVVMAGQSTAPIVQRTLLIMPPHKKYVLWGSR